MEWQQIYPLILKGLVPAAVATALIIGFYACDITFKRHSRTVRRAQNKRPLRSVR